MTTVIEWNMPSQPEMVTAILGYLRDRYQFIDTCITEVDGEIVLLVRGKGDAGLYQSIIRVKME